ncbi:hypothetical protein [Rhodococcus koreensis]|uniref:hypothetical protein n=1 Tax=Rhodococcus koreensis TaxID=99653 RepID=UPI0036715D04
MIADIPEDFFAHLDRLEEQAERGDAHAVQVLAHVTAALADLAALEEPPSVDLPGLKRVRQSRRYPVWRTSHPFDEGVAVRVICWFPLGTDVVVVALFAGDKAQMGDVFYNSVGSRADAAIEQWLFETRGEDHD